MEAVAHLKMIILMTSLIRLVIFRFAMLHYQKVIFVPLVFIFSCCSSNVNLLLVHFKYIQTSVIFINSPPENCLSNPHLDDTTKSRYLSVTIFLTRRAIYHGFYHYISFILKNNSVFKIHLLIKKSHPIPIKSH